MGDLILFPLNQSRVSPQSKQKKKRAFYRVVDLEGESPKGHIPAKRGPRGKALIAKGQIWIEVHNDMLWVVKEFPVCDSPKSNLVKLQAYRGEKTRILTEQTLRGLMHVWEDHLQAKEVLVAKLHNACGDKDTFGSTCAFFGVDAKGNRID